MLTRLYKDKKTSLQQGFTMFEVLISIITLSAFVAATLQLIVINAMFKAKGEREAQAFFWIQEDKEDIFAYAAGFPEVAEPPEAHEAHCNNTDNNPYSLVLWRGLAGKDPGAPAEGATADLILKSGPDIVSTKEILHKQYQLKRTYIIARDKPQILKIEFEVVDSNSGRGEGGSRKEATRIGAGNVRPEVYDECVP